MPLSALALVLYQNILCAAALDYLACMRKKSEIIGDYSGILGDVWL